MEGGAEGRGGPGLLWAGVVGGGRETLKLTCRKAKKISQGGQLSFFGGGRGEDVATRQMPLCPVCSVKTACRDKTRCRQE